MQVAFQQADFAGWNLWAAINDRPLLPFRLDLQALCSYVFYGFLKLATWDSNNISCQKYIKTDLANSIYGETKNIMAMMIISE